MSRIYFHAEDRTEEVSGSERAHMSVLLTDHAYDRLLHSEAARRVLSITEDTWDRNRFGGAALSGRPLTVGGLSLDYASLILNTALADGPDPLRLAARLHGQCEIHAYVEGPNRAWLADVIEQGYDDDVFRRRLVTDQGETYDQGWGRVLDLLRSESQSPVVTSYSVTEGWPDVMVVRDFGDWRPTLTSNPDSDEWWAEYEEAFYAAPNSWSIAMAALRKADKEQVLEISPNDFRTMRFDGGETVDDVIRVAESAIVA